MPSLRLTFDARGAQQSAQPMVDALNTVKRTASDAAAALYGLGGTRIADPGKTLGTIGTHVEGLSKKSIGMARDISQATASVGAMGVALQGVASGGINAVSGALNVATLGAFEFARAAEAIQEMRMAQALNGVAEGAGAAAKQSSVLAMLWKAHPLLIIGTVLAAAATAIGIFGSQSEKAAEAQKKLAEEMEKVQRLGAAARLGRFGGEFAASAFSQQQDANRSLMLDLEMRRASDKAREFPLFDASGTVFGPGRVVTNQGLQQRLGVGGDEYDSLLKQAGIGSSLMPLTVEQGQSVVMEQMRRAEAADKARQEREDAAKRGLSAGGLIHDQDYGYQDQRRLSGLSEHDRNVEIESRKVLDEAKQRNIALTSQETEKIKQQAAAWVTWTERAQEAAEMRAKFTELGQSIGTSLGDAFTSAIMGVTSWRNAAMGALQDVAAQLMRMTVTTPIAQGLGSLFGSIAGGVAGGGGTGGTTTASQWFGARLTPSQQAGSYDAIARNRTGRR